MRILITLAICAFLVTPAMAAFVGPGGEQPGKPGLDAGFKGPVAGAMADTVAKARNLPDDAPVILTGHIISQLAGSKDKFNFRDSSGEIIVDIDRKVFHGRTVTPADTVRLSGKVDKDFGKDIKIDVKVLDIVSQ